MLHPFVQLRPPQPKRSWWKLIFRNLLILLIFLKHCLGLFDILPNGGYTGDKVLIIYFNGQTLGGVKR